MWIEEAFPSCGFVFFGFLVLACVCVDAVRVRALALCRGRRVVWWVFGLSSPVWCSLWSAHAVEESLRVVVLTPGLCLVACRGGVVP